MENCLYQVKTAFLMSYIVSKDQIVIVKILLITVSENM